MSPRQNAHAVAAPQVPGIEEDFPLDPYRIALLILAVLTISKLHGYFGFIRVFRPAMVIVLFCTVYAMINPGKLSSGSLFRTWPAKMMLFLGIIVCLGVPFGLSMGRSGKFILQDYSKTLIGAFLLISTIRATADLRRLTWAVAIAGGVLAFLSIFIVGISKKTDAVTYDANDVGLIMAFTLPVALLTIQTSKGTIKWLAMVGALLIGATVAKTQSRGAFLALLVVGAGLLFLLPGISIVKRVGAVVVAALAMIIAAPPGYWDSMGTILADPKSDYNYSAVNGRRQLAKRGIGYMMTYPAFGVGINNFPLAEGTISDKALQHVPGTGIRWAAAHNSYVQVGAEAGVSGLILWAGMLLGGIFGLRKLGKRMPKSWGKKGTTDQRFLFYACTYLPISILGFMAAAFFVSFAWLDPFYIIGALLAGVYMCVGGELAKAKSGDGAPQVTTVHQRRRGQVPMRSPQPLPAPGPVVGVSPRIAGPNR